MILIELFSQAHKWERTKKTKFAYSYKFTAGERDIIVDFDRAPDDEKSEWDVAFGEIKHGSKNMSLQVTGSGDEFKVFSTVIEIIKDFLNEEDPDSLSFTAEKSEGSRAKLYQKMVDRLVGGKWKKKVDHKVSDYRSYFTIIKK